MLYVPVLQLKDGECKAVRHLAASDKHCIVPLFEVPAYRPPPDKNRPAPKQPKQKVDWLTSTADKIRDSWGTVFPCVRRRSRGCK